MLSKLSIFIRTFLLYKTLIFVDFCAVILSEKLKRKYANLMWFDILSIYTRTGKKTFTICQIMIYVNSQIMKF